MSLNPADAEAAPAQAGAWSGATRVLLLLAVLILAPVLLLPADPGEDALSLNHLVWLAVPDAGQPAAPEGPRQPFPLPLAWNAREESGLHRVVLELPFTLGSAPTGAWSVLLRDATPGGQVQLNGHWVGSIPEESEARHVAWRRPFLLNPEPGTLLQGTNVLRIETTYGPGRHRLGAVELGPAPTIWNRYTRALCADFLAPWAGLVTALLVSGVFLALSWRRNEPVARFLAVAALSGGLWIGCGLIEIVPAPLAGMLAGFTEAARGACHAALAGTLLRMAHLARAREMAAVWLLAAAGPLLLALSGGLAASYLPYTWQPALVLVLATVVGIGLARQQRGQAAPPPAALLAGLVFCAAGAWDALGGSDGRSAGLVLGPVLVGLAAPLIAGLVRTARASEAARIELEVRVREREQLLKRNFERLRESERVKVEAQERQRIMQDMHDGLGSQLMSSLMLVERGGVRPEQFAQILRESIDDMRLAIDAMAAEDADLAAALGNLRYRMEPRLRAAGMALAWDARNLPAELGLHTNLVLPVLRIVQEALTNALKHSRAAAVRVTLSTDGTGDSHMLDIRVADNGSGIGEGRTGGGRGLLNMRHRAQKIGAQLTIESAPRAGTAVHLRMRLGPAPAPRNNPPTVLNTQAAIEHARHI
jgi:signal transduction histidine kinase